MKDQIEKFVSEWQAKYDDYMQRNFPRNPNPRIETKEGHRYTKVVREGSVIGFIDNTTGDIYKAAGWKAPAKHSRGNVNSKQNGMEAIDTRNGTYHPHVRYLA